MSQGNFVRSKELASVRFFFSTMMWKVLFFNLEYTTQKVFWVLFMTSFKNVYLYYSF